MDKGSWRRLLLYCWLLWAALLLTYYYREIGQALTMPGLEWLHQNYSLASFLRGAMRLLVDEESRAFPYWGEALGRASRGLIGAGAVLLAAQPAGFGARRLLRWIPDNWRDALLQQTSLGLGVLSYVSLAAAIAGWYRPATVRALTALFLLAGALLLLRQTQRATATCRSPRDATARWLERRYSCTVATRKTDWLWIGIAFLGAGIALVGALAPEVEWDALWYHLWLPQQWLSAGRPVDIVTEYISLYPLTWELIFGSGLVLGGPVAAKLLHFATLPLTALAVYQFAARFFPRVSPWLAVAIFVTVPTVLWEATTAYIDLALAFHTILALYALLCFLERQQWSWLVLAAVNLGLALATKHLALLLLLLASAGLAARLWLETRDWRRTWQPVVVLMGVALLFPLPWYLRSWIASGNPVFPDLYPLFGALPAERWSTVTEQGLAAFKDHFGDPRTPLNLLLLPWNVTVHAARYGGNLGPIFLLAIPALLVTDQDGEMRWLLAFVVGYLALWASPVSSFQMRFLVPLTPLLALLAASALSLLGNGRMSRNVTVALALLLLLNLPPFTSLHEGDREGWSGWLTHVVHEIPMAVVVGQESQVAYLQRRVPSYAAWQFINDSLPQDAYVLTFSGGDHYYSERRRLASDATAAHPAVWGAPAGQEEAARQQLQELGITHILLDQRELENGATNLALLQPDVLTHWYEVVYRDERFVLYGLGQRQTAGADTAEEQTSPPGNQASP